MSPADDGGGSPAPWHQALDEGLVAAMAAAVLVLLLSVLQYVALRDRLVEELQTQAEIVGRTANAAVLFDSASDAQEILESLAGSPMVLQGRLLRADGRPLAEFNRGRGTPDGWSRRVGEVQVRHAIVANGKEVGRLEVRAGLGSVWVGLAKFVASALTVMLMSLALTLVASRRMRARVREVEARTRFLAAHDALTGLPNRTSFHMLLAHAQGHWERRSRQDALLFVDIDNFKQINDRLGHAAGDAVLQTVAQRLRDAVRQGDVVARLSGDEFAVLLDAADAAAATRVATEVVRRLPEPIAFEGTELRVSASVGVALLPGDARTPEDAIRCADTAMYEAKRAGKDAYHFYSAQLGEAMKARLTLEADLRAGLPRGELSLAYQPIFDAKGKVVSFEALSRWQHPVRGWVPPQEFIAVAEQSELIASLGLGLLRRLRTDLEHWGEQGVAMPRVAVNLSARQFKRQGQRQVYLDLLHELGLQPSVIEFELTESNVFEDIDSPDSILVALQGMGYALSIDDFGTGYSSLGYLRRMRCSKLKIDRSFVKGVGVSEDASTLVQSIIDVAHSLRMQVVAEGVETGGDLAHLQTLRCDFYQGFGLGRPMSFDQVVQLMRRQAAGERVAVGA
ncbi:putative bifunctional diguanylate cyclase/phosphodiesterase [Ideonella sp. YS5]|uniref:putative bifunctional diguanylate cyclase/phosphodiesterase n=1 Tax=Ideonella sp. YS5 TaxID=3453714 RepID=UPI003EEBE196